MRKTQTTRDQDPPAQKSVSNDMQRLPCHIPGAGKKAYVENMVVKQSICSIKIINDLLSFNPKHPVLFAHE